MSNYSMRKQVETSFDETVLLVREALHREGFGVLTEINVSATLKKKLDVNYPNYLILGACHPASAYAALTSDKEIGLLLPCNVVIYEENNAVVVSAIRPTVGLQIADKNAVAPIASEVEAKMQRVMNQI